MKKMEAGALGAGNVSSSQQTLQSLVHSNEMILAALPTTMPHPTTVHSNKQKNPQRKSISKSSRQNQKPANTEPPRDDEDDSEESGGSCFEDEIGSNDSDLDGDYQEAPEFDGGDRDAKRRRHVTKQTQALLQNRNLASLPFPSRAVSTPSFCDDCDDAGLYH